MGGVQRFRVADALAEQLGIGNADYLTLPLFGVLSDMVSELELVLDEGPKNWLDDLSEDRPGRIAHAATESLNVTEIVDTLRQLGRRKLRPPLSISNVDDLHAALEQRLCDYLSPRIRKMLDQWRARGAWEDDLKLGIITSPKARERDRQQRSAH
jgi:hypothetical protein